MLQLLHMLAMFAAVSAVAHAESQSPIVARGSDIENDSWAGDVESQRHERVIYTMSNLSPNSLIAIAANGSGVLSSHVSYTPTEGDGGNFINAVTGKPDQPDPLSSADAVIVVEHFVFNVNAGSNTVSMFEIDPERPMSPTLLGIPQDSQGIFPNSVAASLRHKVVCVANTGVEAGVACAKFDSLAGLGPFDTLRPFDVGQTQTPPVGPTPGVGDIIFNWDESVLVVLAKGDGKDVEGFVQTYEVFANGSVSKAGKQYFPPELNAEFGSVNVPNAGNHIYSSQADFGSVVLNLDNLTATPKAKTNVTGQGASCWAQVSSFTGTGFLTDPTINRLVETNLTAGGVVSEFYPPNDNIGMTDFRVVGTTIWLLAAGNGTTPPSICVIDISGGPGSAREIQNFAVPSGTPNLQGLAVYGM